MTPTQAQIEAAVWEVLTEWRAEMHDNVKHSLARRIAERIGHFIDRPTTALTAAIGVPDQEHIPQKPGQKPGLLPNGNIAAEVGERPYLKYDDVIEARIAVTIERCAQVAEDELEESKRCGDADDEIVIGQIGAASRILAGIEALKEKP